MSNDEELKFIGALFVDLQKSNQKKEAIESEIDRISISLKEISKVLSRSVHSCQREDLYNAGLDVIIADIPKSDKVLSLLNDLREERERNVILSVRASKLRI